MNLVPKPLIVPLREYDDPGFFSRVAVVAGYSRTHISRVFRGKVGYSPKSLKRIADACGVSEGELARFIRRRAGEENEDEESSPIGNGD